MLFSLIFFLDIAMKDFLSFIRSKSSMIVRPPQGLTLPLTCWFGTQAGRVEFMAYTSVI